LVGLGRGIKAFEVSRSCGSIEEAVFDILKPEIRGICSVKTRLWLQECPIRIKLPRTFKRPDYSNGPYKNFKLPLMTRIIVKLWINSFP
jgi:hypothetical protein